MFVCCCWSNLLIGVIPFIMLPPSSSQLAAFYFRMQLCVAKCATYFICVSVCWVVSPDPLLVHFFSSFTSGLPLALSQHFDTRYLQHICLGFGNGSVSLWMQPAVAVAVAVAGATQHLYYVLALLLTRVESSWVDLMALQTSRINKWKFNFNLILQLKWTPFGKYWRLCIV